MTEAALKPKEQSSRDIRRTAHDWCAQIEAGELDAAERQRFENWLAADPSHRTAYKRAASLWQEVGELDETALPAQALKPLLRERFLAWCDVGWRRWFWRFAGSAAAFATVAFLLLQVLPAGWYVFGADHFDTAVAEIREVTLSDGSKVTLGAQTSLSVTMEEDGRRIRLHRGEAYFEVAKDSARPFSVRAGHGQVRVVGTAFDLQRLETGLEVAVAEGRVEVGSAIASGERASKTLRAGQQVSVSIDGKVGRIDPVDTDQLGAWRRDRLIYLGATLAEVVADANRYRDGWIILRDREVAELKITGAFDAGDIDRMLATLADALPISLWQPLDAIVVIGHRDPAAGR